MRCRPSDGGDDGGADGAGAPPRPDADGDDGGARTGCGGGDDTGGGCCSPSRWPRPPVRSAARAQSSLEGAAVFL